MGVRYEGRYRQRGEAEQQQSGVLRSSEKKAYLKFNATTERSGLLPLRCRPVARRFLERGSSSGCD